MIWRRVNQSDLACPRCGQHSLKSRRWQHTVRWKCSKCGTYAVLAPQRANWDDVVRKRYELIATMVKHRPMPRRELAERLGVQDRAMGEWVHAMIVSARLEGVPAPVHEWDGQVYAGPGESYSA